MKIFEKYGPIRNAGTEKVKTDTTEKHTAKRQSTKTVSQSRSRIGEQRPVTKQMLETKCSSDQLQISNDINSMKRKKRNSVITMNFVNKAAAQYLFS